MKHNGQETRLEIWLRLTSLPPPELRGFRPRTEPDSRFDYERTIRERYRDKKYWEAVEKRRQKPENDADKVRGFMPKWSLPDPSWQNNSNPWQENAIRAWEECD